MRPIEHRNILVHIEKRRKKVSRRCPRKEEGEKVKIFFSYTEA
jgi:hypothetical protein